MVVEAKETTHGDVPWFAIIVPATVQGFVPWLTVGVLVTTTFCDAGKSVTFTSNDVPVELIVFPAPSWTFTFGDVVMVPLTTQGLVPCKAVTVPLTGCVAGKLFTLTVWTAGKFDTLVIQGDVPWLAMIVPATIHGLVLCVTATVAGKFVTLTSSDVPVEPRLLPALSCMLTSGDVVMLPLTIHGDVP
jgi:hypothetical protein